MLVRSGRPTGILRRGRRLWIPLEDSSLRIFLDAKDLSTLTGSGGTLTSWTNKAPLGGTFTPLTAQSPTYDSGVVTFPFGVSSTLIAPSRFGIATNPNLTVVAICAPTVATDQRIVAVGINSGVATPGTVQTQININDVAWRHDNGASIFSGGGSSAKTLFAMSRPSGSYANATARRNGSQLTLTTQGLGNASPTSTLDSTIIARGLWSGDVFGILVFESADQALIDRVEGWAARYFDPGSYLTDLLPANHPFKTSAPLID